MIYPPSILRIRIMEEGRKKIGLWFPLFLLWPFMLAISILLLPLVLIVSLILWPSGRGKKIILAFPLIFNLICNMRGLRVDVRGANDNVFVNFL
ncbi:MAG: hypothetical protein GF310_04750 [candidate division Zixibacteria bacterium]|nr:hypothetical protein [candidate division Zixibacteria bacterium]